MPSKDGRHDDRVFLHIDGRWTTVDFAEFLWAIQILADLSSGGLSSYRPKSILFTMFESALPGGPRRKDKPTEVVVASIRFESPGWIEILASPAVVAAIIYLGGQVFGGVSNVASALISSSASREKRAKELLATFKPAQGPFEEKLASHAAEVVVVAADDRRLVAVSKTKPRPRRPKNPAKKA